MEGERSGCWTRSEIQRQMTELEMALQETTLMSSAVIDTVSSLIKEALAAGIITSEKAALIRNLN